MVSSPYSFLCRQRARDQVRRENVQLQKQLGMLGNETLLRHYEEQYDEVESLTEYVRPSPLSTLLGACACILPDQA